MRLTARARLETWAHVSRVQSDEVTYDLERTVVGSVVAGVTSDRCGQCGACDRAVVSVAVGNGEAGDMAVTDVLDRAQAWLKAANERGINVTDENGYLAVISDLAAEVTKLREQVSESIADMRELRDELRATRIQWLSAKACLQNFLAWHETGARMDNLQLDRAIDMAADVLGERS